MNTRFRMAAISAAALLAACGGGNNFSVPTVAPNISGLAATGAALGNATITAKCTTGTPVTGKTLADGTFSLDLTGGQIAPCLVQVSSGSVTIYGYAGAAGRINVTPLTDLVLNRALGSDPTAAFAAFDATKADTIKKGLDAAKKYVGDEIKALVGSAPTGDLLTGVFKVGDADDKILDALGTELTKGNKTLDDLRGTALAGTPIKAALSRGTLLASDVDNAKVLITVPKAAIDAGPLVGLTGAALCDVKVVALNYNTIGFKGEATNASGVMLLPTGTGCATPKGLVAYAKGTDVQKPHTLANPADAQTGLLMAVYAAQGYAVVATDYLGYAKSTYSFHPYLHADSEATSVIDSIRAARNAAALPAINATLPNKILLTGYSQGGHSSMATHRAIERDHAKEMTVVAGAHLAGPYNLSGSVKVTTAIAGVQYFVPFLVTAWQTVYGNIYAKVSDVFKAPYDSYIETLLPSPTLDFTTLVTTGKLPGAMGETPTQARDAVFQAAFLTDTQTNNDNALFKAAKKNDLLGWTPKSPVLLCGGSGDPTVPVLVHMTPMKADFDARGVKNVTVVDVDSTISFLYGPPTPTNAATYYGNYHGTYEPPLCAAQAKGAFDAALLALGK